MAYPCLEEARRYIRAYEALWDVGVNPRRAMRDLQYMAETGDPLLPEALRRYADLLYARYRLMRCTARHYEEL